MSATHHVFLSPHLDDAVLSCGGMIVQLAQAGHVVQVVTVFSGDPPPGALTPFAQSLHQRWQADYADRRREDRESLSMIGAGAIQWPYPEAIYRHDRETGAALYDSESSIFGEVHPADAPTLASIVDRLRAVDSSAQVMAPLAAGHHVDHQIVRAAAESAAREVAYYEDYPYVESPDVRDAAMQGRGWTAEVVYLSDDDIRAKAAAIWAHRSQMSTFFSGEAEMAQRVRAYACLVGGEGRPAERVWRLRRG